jgi:hypothetical protein
MEEREVNRKMREDLKGENHAALQQQQKITHLQLAFVCVNI